MDSPEEEREMIGSPCVHVIKVLAVDQLVDQAICNSLIMGL